MIRKKAMPAAPTGEIILYAAGNGQTALDVTLEDETVWLTQRTMGELFQKDVRTINEHIQNIFKEGELKRNSVIRKFRITAPDGKNYQMNFYNLDVIISVGYRVKSKRGTLFRQWALKVLHNHIVKGFTINEKRLKEEKEMRLKELEKTISLLQNTMYRQELTRAEAVGLLHVITDYSRSWLLLEQYDQKSVALPLRGAKTSHPLSYDESVRAIEKLKDELMKKKEAGDVFGVERNKGLHSILANIEQTFDGQPLYAGLEEKAAHLLYFIIKDHPFVDGNKRIGSFLFILYLSQNNFLYAKNGEKRINDNALVALALLVAESNPREKDIMIALIANLLH